MAGAGADGGAAAANGNAPSAGATITVAGADLDAAGILLASAGERLSGRGGAQVVILDEGLTEEMLLEGTAGGAHGSGMLIIVPGEPGGEMTGEERRAGLDKELNVSLAVFDGKLITEQQRILASRGGGAGAGAPGRHDDQAGAGGEEDGFGRPPPAQPARGSDDGAGSSSGAGRVPGGAPSRTGTGTGSGAGAAAIPADIPDGDDDDVVARQLREAAMNEADPELREKLWDEYRAYKSGTGR
jgi:hypothetical protein